MLATCQQPPHLLGPGRSLSFCRGLVRPDEATGVADREDGQHEHIEKDFRRRGRGGGPGHGSRPALADEAVSARWVDSADLVVVGGGGAGFCAAIEAANAGASVLVLEKAGFCGGNTQLSNGMLMAAGTKEQLELAGCDTDTPEAFAEQQVAYAQGHGDAEMIRDMCLHSPEAVEFMTGLGRVYAD